MDSDAALLAAAATTLDELIRRIVECADARFREGDEEAAHALYDVERSLRTADRRLTRIVRNSGA